jgi:hypothetical protein
MSVAGLPGATPLDYAGIPVNVVPLKVFFRRPLTTDKKYRIGQMAILGRDPSTGVQGELWYLANFNSSGDAIWLQLSAGSSTPAVDSITTDDGNPPVEPDGAGNVNILGGTGIITSGNGPGNTVTISVDGDLVATQYDANAGSAVPAGGILNIVGSAGITTSASGNTVTITQGGGGLTWNTITGATQAMAVNNGYFANRGAGVTFTLPVSAAFGSVFVVSAINAGGWTIAQNVGQQIQFGALNTTAGAGGSLASTAIGDTVYLVCSVANTNFVVINSIGNITVV